MENEFLTTDEAAELLRTSVGTLSVMRCRRQGPPYMKLGKKVLYPRADLETWLQSHRVTPEPAPESIAPAEARI